MASPDRLTTLRFVTQQLISTSIPQLPKIAPVLASSVSRCGDCLDLNERESNSTLANEGLVLVHKLRTQITSLIQDKAPEARYTAILLIKSLVEIEGQGTLQIVIQWVKNLIGILTRTDSCKTKTLCVITLTRIFNFPWDNSTLVRGSKTESLRGFISSCLVLFKSSVLSHRDAASRLSITILKAFNEIVPHHHTSFSRFSTELRKLLLPLLAPTPSNFSANIENTVSTLHVCTSARQLFVQLFVCAIKKGPAGERRYTLNDIITSTHKTADAVFRAIHESFRTQSEYHDTGPSLRAEQIVSDRCPSPLDLPPWQGIIAGMERLDGLLNTLNAFICIPSQFPLTLPLGKILEVSERVLSVTHPDKGQGTRRNPDISRDERDLLFACLPRIHISALRCCSHILSRLSNDAIAMSQSITDLVLWTLSGGSDILEIRRTSYQILIQILRYFGPSLTSKSIDALSVCLKLCCEDLIPTHTDNVLQTGQKRPYANGDREGNLSLNRLAGTMQKGLSLATPNLAHGCKASAAKLLSLILRRTSEDRALLTSLYQQLNQTAILVQSKEMMLASLLTVHAKSRNETTSASIIPLLVRSFPDCPEIDLFLRPQMPLIMPRFDREDTLFDDREAELSPNDVGTLESIQQVHQLQRLSTLKSGDVIAEHVGTGTDSRQTSDDYLPLHVEKRQKTTHDRLPARLDDSISISEMTKATAQEQIDSDQATNGMVGIGKPFQVPETDWSSRETAGSTLSQQDSPSLPLSTNGPADADRNSGTHDGPHAQNDESESEFEIPPLDLGSGSDEDESADDGAAQI